MMHIHMIDGSGSMCETNIDLIKRSIRVGDLVGCFDTMVHNAKFMTSQQDIDCYQMQGGCGTFFSGIADFVSQLHPNTRDVAVVVYGDMYFADAINVPDDTQYEFVVVGNTHAPLLNSMRAKGLRVRPLISRIDERINLLRSISHGDAK